MPYDRTADVDDYARCFEEPTGLRPVRRTVGEQVYAAVDVCVDSERGLPGEIRGHLRDAGRRLFINFATQTRLARRVNAGVFMEAGPARITVEEQWWTAPPVSGSDGAVGLAVADGPPSFKWLGEESPRTTRCMEMASGSAAQADGRVVRRHSVEIPRDEVGWLAPISARQACAHLDCINPTLDAAGCEADCPGWVLPFAFKFERVEPASRADLCP